MRNDVSIGSQAPDLAYTRPDGLSARLSDLWQEKAVFVVWLRQCG